MLMTSQMKTSLTRYGGITFFNLKRPITQVGWIYIGILVHNILSRAYVYCEAIVTGKAILVYTWLINTPFRFKPKWNVPKLSIIFVD